MADYKPPSESLPIFDYSQFQTVTGAGLSQAQGDALYLGRQGSASSIASDTSFSGLVSFNNLSTAPTCQSAPVNQTDLCNKSYVDSQAPLTAFQLFCNYSATYGGYKLLDTNEVYTASTLSFSTLNTTPVLVAGFFNSLASLNLGSMIPPGNWSLLCYANCATISDQSHIGMSYSIVGMDGIGTETVLFSSVSSPLVSVVSPLMGCYSTTFSVPQTDISMYVSLGVKIYATGNDAVSRTGNIQFQQTGSYSSVLTSFAVTQPANLLSLNNTWTGTNNFTASTVIQGGLSTLGVNSVNFGSNALTCGLITAGSYNLITIGSKSLAGTTLVTNNSLASLTGTNNTICGSGAGSLMTTGSFNTFIGNLVCNLGIVTGSSNTCVGQTSTRDLISGNANTSVGRYSGTSITTGSFNTNIGFNTGISTNKNLTGSNNTTLGMDAICGVDGLSYATAIGSGASVSTSNTLVLGRATDTINVSGDLILTGASPVINTSTPAAFLDFQTAAGGTGYMNFSPRNTLAFQIAPGSNTSVKIMDFQAGLTMSGGNANLSTSTLTCGAITTSGNLILNNATLANRTITAVTYNMTDFTTGADNGFIRCNSGAFVYDNNFNGGNHLFAANTVGGVQVFPLTLTATSITNGVNITLPVNGSAPTASTQLGGTSLVTSALSSLASGTFRSIQSASLPIGTYIFNGAITYYCTAIGGTKFLSAGFNTAGTSFASGGTQLGNSTTQIGSTANFTSTAQITNLSSSCVVTVTTAAIYYFNAYWLENAAGIAFNVGLTASFTRIA